MRLPRRSELSEQQEDFLMDAPFDKPVICVGPPGTGKTVLALYRSVKLNQQNMNVDFIMHSKLLKRYVERSVEELNIKVNSKTWHSWLYSLWYKGKCGGKLPEIKAYLPDFHKAIKLIKDGKPVKPQNMYWSHLIIDEGQDFPKEFYLFLTVLRLQGCIINGRIIPGITIFADENQRMEEERNSTIKEIMAYMPELNKYEVNLNYRNSGPIAKLANYFYVGLSTGISTPPKNAQGLLPRLRRFETLEDEARSIVQWLSNNDDLSAGVIVPNTKIQNKIIEKIRPLAKERNLKLQNYSSGNDVNKIDFYKPGTITVLCDKSCKGLEFDGVFIPHLQAYRSDAADEVFFKMKMYVMISRARTYLQLSFSECNDEPSILKVLPSPELETLKWEV